MSREDFQNEKDEIAYYSKMDLEKAIKRASRGMVPHGTGLHPHFRHLIGNEAQFDALSNLQTDLLAIQEVLSIADSFESLFASITEVCESIRGCGPLVAFDVALWIGASRGLFPNEVYLHRGARKGAVLLGLDGAKSRRSVPMAALPAALHGLAPYQIETFLCWLAGIEE